MSMSHTEDRAPKAPHKEALELVGRSSKIAEVLAMVDRVAATDIPVLICGESGSGKEVVAQLIHLRSARKQGPFLKVSCAAIPHELLESELFGYERGSFTGALNSKPGKFELAQGGTIFLDEISEMGPGVQPKLLQVLQDKQFCRLGAQREVTVDVRAISSTNRSLESLLAKGKFRPDLYYRLNVITIRVPALRERKEDLPDLVQHLLKRHNGKGHHKTSFVSDRLLTAFAAYDWPGNVRELENTIRRLLALGEESVLLEHFAKLPDPSSHSSHPHQEDVQPLGSLRDVARRAALQAEHDMILLALQKTNWNRKRAAEMLQISYKAMLYKLKEIGLAKRSGTVYSA
jgi:two-component system response regulator AtoC